MSANFWLSKVENEIIINFVDGTSAQMKLLGVDENQWIVAKYGPDEYRINPNSIISYRLVK